MKAKTKKLATEFSKAANVRGIDEKAAGKIENKT
jgi:hypothetical protein